MLGSDALDFMNSFAKARKDLARDTSKISHHKLTSLKTSGEAWKELTKGARLKPRQVKMSVAFDDEPSESLEKIMNALRKHYRLSIGLVVVKGKKITLHSR